ncbi:MAG: allantoate amidohydrolase [Gammaproteobacteria bacterium]|nr:allantoate amidohydrolase [Gammaproteobacteria bacterium]
MSINGQLLIDELDALARISEESSALTRTFLTPAHQQAAQTLLRWMSAAGMETRLDAAANVVGRYEGHTPGLPALMIGSHYDTVRDAGRYDGAYGILAALHCIRALVDEQLRFPFAIEVVGFSEEEGVRYNATLLGSRAIAGNFDTDLLAHKDADGISMSDAFRDAGLNPDNIGSAARSPDELLAFIELHIEQGPVLLAEEQPVGIVSAIAGAKRFDISALGLAGHAGTVPMEMRFDAGAATAEAVLMIEETCRATEGMVGTVGKINVPGGAANVIPGKVHFSIDMRSGDSRVLNDTVKAVEAQLQEIGARRKVSFDVRQTHAADATPCSDVLKQQLSEAIQRQSFRPILMPSGAGHDAMAMHALTPMAMLFVRCGNGGISHHPDEIISADDAAAGADILLDFIRHFKAPV